MRTCLLLRRRPLLLLLLQLAIARARRVLFVRRERHRQRKREIELDYCGDLYQRLALPQRVHAQITLKDEHTERGGKREIDNGEGRVRDRLPLKGGRPTKRAKSVVGVGVEA